MLLDKTRSIFLSSYQTQRRYQRPLDLLEILVKTLAKFNRVSHPH